MYIFKNGNKFIGMDNASGGYPYETDRAFSAHEWSTIKDARDYQKMFSDEWILYEFKSLNLVMVEE